MSARAAAASLVVAALGFAGCGGSSDGATAEDPATTGFSPEEQAAIDEALEEVGEREKRIFPSFTPAQQDGYRAAFIVCTGYIESYGYTLVTDYIMAREDAALGSVEDAEATGCSDANADDPLPGSGFSRRDP